LLRQLAAAHDLVTRAGFGAAALCVAVITGSFCVEVVARYFFNAPTSWATPLVTYSLCAMIFLALPELTRQAAHIAINILVDKASGTVAHVLRGGACVLAAVACLLAAWFSADASWGQYEQDIWTQPPFDVPKWSISLLIPYGMLNAALHFLRQLFRGGPAAGNEGSPL
jgi:TRAP-type C4-dicarboxylate transport system permease small subunit